MSKKLRLYTLFLIVIAIGATILSYAWVTTQVPTPSEWQTWLLQTVVYLGLLALFTCFLGPIAYRHYSEYCEGRKLRRLEKKKKLESKKDAYRRCTSQIEYNIKERVQKDDFKYHADISYNGLPSDAQKKVKEYVKNYGRCRDWFEACSYVIQSILESSAKSTLPETRKKYALDSDLQSDDITKMFANGEKVTSSWLKEHKPRVYQRVKKSLKEPEGEEQLDTFFLNINGSFEANCILKRFRNEKKALIEYGFEVIDDLKDELQASAA